MTKRIKVVADCGNIICKDIAEVRCISCGTELGDWWNRLGSRRTDQYEYTCPNCMRGLGQSGVQPSTYYPTQEDEREEYYCER